MHHKSSFATQQSCCRYLDSYRKLQVLPVRRVDVAVVVAVLVEVVVVVVVVVVAGVALGVDVEVAAAVELVVAEGSVDVAGLVAGDAVEVVVRFLFQNIINTILFTVWRYWLRELQCKDCVRHHLFVLPCSNQGADANRYASTSTSLHHYFNHFQSCIRPPNNGKNRINPTSETQPASLISSSFSSSEPLNPFSSLIWVNNVKETPANYKLPFVPSV
jgi:hypothetical protein